jgi:adenylate cyclase class 2
MGVEVEKKYRLTRDELKLLQRRLVETGAVRRGPEEFEVNTLYNGHGLDPQTRVLRLRRTDVRAVFTYKERDASASAIKHQREDETEVSDPDALAAILDALGYRPALVYEKRRTTWHVAGVELVIDELPFGLFMEIEGPEKAIIEAEALLHLTETEAVLETYPALAARHGVKRGEIMEARFRQEDVANRD